jgi:hypothetical protein
MTVIGALPVRGTVVAVSVKQLNHTQPFPQIDLAVQLRCRRCLVGRNPECAPEGQTAEMMRQRQGMRAA